MSKCEKRCIDCIHFDMCADLHAYYKRIDKERVIAFMCDGHSDKLECGHYKDKSLFVELPVPYGTELHFLWSREHADKPQPPRVHSTRDWIFKTRDDGRKWLSSNDIPVGYYGEYLHELGKTVFLTKEEAERKLKEEIK